MSQELVERVARAICRASYRDREQEHIDLLVNSYWMGWERHAVAAIEAMEQAAQ